MKQVTVPMVTGANGIQAQAVNFNEVVGGYHNVDPAIGDAHGIKAGVPLGDPRLAAVTVDVLVPDEDVDPATGKLNPDAIARRYPGHFLVLNGTFKGNGKP